MNFNNIFFIEMIQKINFPLRKLALDKQTNFLGSEENSLKFLNKFVDTLEELELGSTFSASVYEMIFMKFKKLKVLDLQLMYAPKENTFYHNLRPNVSVKKLIIRNLIPRCEQMLQGFIGNLPNVESLTLVDSGLSKEMVQFISNNMQQLEELKLPTLKSSSLKDVVLPNIKSLHIRFLETVYNDDWHAICRSLPNIQNFSFKSVSPTSSLSELMFQIFTQCWKNLTHIDLGSGFIPSERIFTMLVHNSKNLKSVSIPAEIKFKNHRLVDFVHKLFEKVQGPRLFYKSSTQLTQEHVGFWDNVDYQRCSDGW